MKTKIITCVSNRPDLLSYQIRSLNKFIEGDYDIIVVYDTRDGKHHDEFKSICDNYGVDFHIHNSQEGGSPSFYHGQSATWAYNNLVKDDCILMLLDHDMFLIDNFNIEDEISIYDVMGVLQTREDVEYIWPGLFFCKSNSLKDIKFDFLPQAVKNQMLDTGGGTYKLLENEKIKYLDTGVEYPDEYKGIDLQDPELTGGYGFELHCDGKFLHSRNACAWHNNLNPNDGKKTNLLFEMLSDILDDNTKEKFEIVIARYNEDLRWAEDYAELVTIYNKGEDLKDTITLENIGREPHTYLYHIVNNYNSLSEYTIFLQGDPVDPHSPNLKGALNFVLNSNEVLPPFFWLSERIVISDFVYEREPYHKIFPNIKYAYNKIFGKEPDIEEFRFGAGAQFGVSRDRIRERPLEFYQNILDIMEHKPEKDLDEVCLKLLGNSGLKKKFCPVNPEISYHMERFWGMIFNEV